VVDQPDQSPFDRTVAWVRKRAARAPADALDAPPAEPPAEPEPPGDDETSWVLAAGSLVAWAVYLLGVAATNDVVLAVLGQAAWYAAGAGVVFALRRRWDAWWALLVPWAVSLLYDNLVDLVAPAFRGAWPSPSAYGDGVEDYFATIGAADFSWRYVVGVGLGVMLAVGVWRQSRAWRAGLGSGHSGAVDTEPCHMVVVGSWILVGGYVVADAFATAGFAGRLSSAGSWGVTLIVAVALVALYADAAPRVAVWVLALGGVYLGSVALRDLVGMAAAIEERPETGAYAVLIVLTGVVAVMQLAWAVVVLRAAVRQRGSVEGTAEGSDVDAVAVVTPADDEGKSLPQSS
jgi:hypothetical protein